MANRINVFARVDDARNRNYKKSFVAGLGGGIKVGGFQVLDSYIIDIDLNEDDLEKVGKSLTNERIENYLINKVPDFEKFTHIVEIGFLPGVTDNVGHTVKESIADSLSKEISDDRKVYTSKIFLLNTSATLEEVQKASFSFYNPLIESGRVYEVKNLQGKNLPVIIPKVVLNQDKDILEVNLNVTDEELIKIGNEGIKDGNGTRRGPLALDLESMKVIQEYFKKQNRKPTDIELESLAQTWSEHCKHTIFANPIDEVKNGLYKTYIKGATNEIRKKKGKKDICVSVFSDNAGGIVFDKNYIITHKVETHNSPSALDPFGGAITGIVGVNRDTIGFGLGAKPVANTFGFCFGYPEDKRTLYRDKDLKQKMLSPERIMEGVVKGVNSGGNCSGIPTVSGFVKFDERFRGKPLVFVGTIGLIPNKINGRSSYKKSAEKGDYVVVAGGRVGADGIHGATFSSVVMDQNSPATAVQIGDPITQKKMSDVIVKEARDKGLYNSITDNGAGGISCSVAEMAKECGGVVVDLEKVPLKYPGLESWQIWVSESQERMTLAVPKNKWEEFSDLMQRRGVEATIIGEFTNSGKCVVKENGNVVMDLEMEFLHNGLPKRQLITESFERIVEEPNVSNKKSYSKDLLDLLKEKNISSFEWISQQYDHEVQASSVLKPLSGQGKINTDAQVFRPVLNSKKGVALSAALFPSYSDIDTYHMTACAIDTSIRNIIAVGGKIDHLAILDNFCWCSSNDRKKLFELKESVKSCFDYATEFGTPFISGKDSMFNDFRGRDESGNEIKISIPPTLVISSVGVIPDIGKVVSPEFKFSGDNVYVLGETNDELGGSEYFKMLANGNIAKIGQNIPKVDVNKNIKIYKALEKAIETGLIASSISINSGGLAIALAKACVGGNIGAEIDINLLKGNFGSAVSAIFSESQGRILVTVSDKNKNKFENLVRGITCTKIGKINNSKKLKIKNTKKQVVVDVTVKELSKSYHSFSGNKISN